MSDRQKARGVSLRVTLHETVNENRTFFFFKQRSCLYTIFSLVKERKEKQGETVSRQLCKWWLMETVHSYTC